MDHSQYSVDATQDIVRLRRRSAQAELLQMGSGSFRVSRH